MQAQPTLDNGRSEPPILFCYVLLCSALKALVYLHIELGERPARPKSTTTATPHVRLKIKITRTNNNKSETERCGAVNCVSYDVNETRRSPSSTPTFKKTAATTAVSSMHGTKYAVFISLVVTRAP